MSRGAPKGNNNAAKGKRWTHAIEWALDKYEKKGVVAQGEALRAIATKMIEEALEGDKAAREEIGNRLDGRPAQSLDVQGHMVTETHEEWLERLSKDDD